MLRLEDCKVVFVAAGLIGVLLFAYPTLSLVIHLPGGEKFSELWILGPEHMAENYPFNVTAGHSYTVYVGVGNQMGSSTYYVVYVKFGNQTEPLPNATAGIPSPLPPLYEYRFFLQNARTWEAPLTFSFLEVLFSNGQSLVKSLTINDVVFNVDKLTSWDTEKNGDYYQLLMELWIYNVESNATIFYNRYVSLWLNMTETV